MILLQLSVKVALFLDPSLSLSNPFLNPQFEGTQNVSESGYRFVKLGISSEVVGIILGILEIFLTYYYKLSAK
jgi:hypothetical protein